jgi:hypothetical protein
MMGGENLLGAITKLTDDYGENIDTKYKEQTIKNISILHEGDDGYIAVAAKKEKEYVQYHFHISHPMLKIQHIESKVKNLK